MTLVDSPVQAHPSGELYEPWLFLSMLDQLSSSEVNIGFVYAVLDLLAERYGLSDAVIVLGNETIGTQAFRLGRKSVAGDSSASTAAGPALYTVPDIVPEIVRDAVVSVGQLSLTMHLARYSADHDPLTAIANRRYFDAALAAAAVRSSRYGWAFTLVMIDLDGFKAVNDRLGHVLGDSLLRSFGGALRRSVRSGDIAARVGGDEFAVILCNAEGSEVLAFTERLRAYLALAPDLQFTFGTATSPRDSTDPAELYRLADARLFEKKALLVR